MTPLQRRYAAQIDAAPVRPVTRREIQANRARVIRAEKLAGKQHVNSPR